jgi:hypothetical protein
MCPRWANGNSRPWKEARVRKGNKEHLHRSTGKDKTCPLISFMCSLECEWQRLPWPAQGETIYPFTLLGLSSVLITSLMIWSTNLDGWLIWTMKDRLNWLSRIFNVKGHSWAKGNWIFSLVRNSQFPSCTWRTHCKCGWRYHWTWGEQPLELHLFCLMRLPQVDWQPEDSVYICTYFTMLYVSRLCNIRWYDALWTGTNLKKSSHGLIQSISWQLLGRTG